jgi:S-adenosyl-L-methionine hydrolase (adenosine-forming)
MPRITLLTDFGTRDGYVGAMKGVLASAAPNALLDDVTHDIPRGDMGMAAYVLERYWDRYPRGTVHLVVVDPGVGTSRRALALEADGWFVVAPDNGVVSRVLFRARQWRAVSVVSPRVVRPEASATFHGRDVFAPAAGHLARGLPQSLLGPPLTDPVRLEPPRPARSGDRWEGRVVYVDRFGNLVTNLPGEVLSGVAEVEVEGRTVPVGRTYGDVEPGRLLALINSDGRVEIAARDASGANQAGVGPGARVRVPISPP